MNTRFRNNCILLLIFANAGCDQVSKNAARKHLSYHETVSIIGNNLIFTKVENTGAFLSTGDSLTGSLKFILLAALPLLALGYGIYYLLTNTQLPRLLVWGISFVIGGGLGNLADRLIYGSVTDFVHVDYYFVKTGIFNLADVSIMVGMILLLIQLYFKRRPNNSLPEASA